jgi:hypothetical protein
MMEAIRFTETLLQKPHGVASQKMAFFIVTAVKTSNLSNLGKFMKHSSDSTHMVLSLSLSLYKKEA